MKTELRVSAGPHLGRTFSFNRHATFVVGRAHDAQCPMPDDPFLSRHHFLVEVNPPVCSVRDLGSTNGIRVNGVRVEHSRLHHGDLITAGNSAFKVVIESSGLLPVACRGCGTHAPPDLTISASPGENVEWYCPSCASRRRRYPRPPKGYWIESWIGGGGMGEVFLARRESDKLPVALKVMMPIVAASERARAYFLREMNVLRNLRHRNIVAFYEAIEDEGQFQLLMEYVDGKGALRWVEAQPGPPPIPAICSIGVQLLLALDHAHRRGFVHRDIKPSNVLVMGGARRPLVKLSDFGLAKNFRDEAGFNGLTIEGDFGGSMGFLSPDHIRDFREVKWPADIYSAGATLYYLLTGHYPFLDFDPKDADSITKTLEHPTVPLRAHRPDAPEALDRILRRSLEKNPADRWPSASAMAEALKPLAVDPLTSPTRQPPSASIRDA
ncbi:FHA domain-containing serine/threonine-protein kinase [Tautonia sociabilis]|uniref:FHA domain-containing protein n=1 Tax=Tautonia sociabilis TaxID=2080755 RepID=A0A432MQ52_9BACT|nr:FHA domain-containing serine/threonine-protein kinase [Tautonia sociabilis]RUL89369.1 FHA domain-containing protein [Tautonia sociabilis]